MRAPLILAALVAAFLLPAAVNAEVASYYSNGHRTANGEHFNPLGMTCAYKKPMPFNTMLRVTYQGRSVVCRVNDRGPFIRGRDIDLSLGAARSIGLIHAGHGRVQIEKL